jgi:hypothetical protein
VPARARLRSRVLAGPQGHHSPLDCCVGCCELGAASWVPRDKCRELGAACCVRRAQFWVRSALTLPPRLPPHLPQRAFGNVHAWCCIVLQCAVRYCTVCFSVAHTCTTLPCLDTRCAVAKSLSMRACLHHRYCAVISSSAHSPSSHETRRSITGTTHQARSEDD